MPLNSESGWGYNASTGVDVGTYTGKSLVFNDGDTEFLDKTYGSEGDRNNWTFSCWVKRSTIGANQAILAAWVDDNYRDVLRFTSADVINFQSVQGGITDELVTNRVFRDTSSWYNIVLSINLSAAEASRYRLFVNGVEETSLATNTAHSADGKINDDVRHFIGARGHGSSPTIDSYFDGYMAQIVFLDGTSVTDASNFGETSADTGAWVMKDVSGLTYGTNGYHLDFATSGDTSTSSDAEASVDWTATGFSSNINLSYTPDTPVNNFCTLNPLSNYEIVLSDGNLKGTGTGSNWDGVASTFAATSGKWYWEVKALSVSEAQAWTAGIHQTGHQNNGLNWYSGSYVGKAYGVMDSNYKVTTGTQSSFTSDIAAGDIVQFRLNLDDDELSISVDGVDKGKVYDISNLDYSPAINMYGTSSVIMNFGQDSSFLGTETATSNADGNGYGTFHSAVPTGYLSLCSANMPDVEIGQEADDLATDHFNTVLYTGTGSSLAVTGVGFSPDLTWVKSRSTSDYQALFDSERGATKYLRSSSDAAETTTAESLKTFDSDGFTLGTNSTWNASSMSGVSWNWLAGTNFDNDQSVTGVGTIDSEGQINEDAGFAIIKYVGNGADSTDIGIAHGLSQTPEFITIKNRSRGSMRWPTWHTDLSADGSYTVKNLLLNTTTGEDAFSAQFKSASSTLFTVRDDDSDGNAFVNRSGDNYIAYLWHSVESYSKISKFVGNGSADGTFVYCGFEPAFVMTKRIDSTSQWGMWDNKRSVNPNDATLYANTDDADVTSEDMDFLSNGFKLRNSNADPANASGGTYIFIAFAKTPFKYATGN